MGKAQEWRGDDIRATPRLFIHPGIATGSTVSITRAVSISGTRGRAKCREDSEMSERLRISPWKRPNALVDSCGKISKCYLHVCIFFVSGPSLK